MTYRRRNALDDELGSFWSKAVGIVKKVASPLVKVVGHVPIIGGLVKAGAEAVSQVDKATGFSKAIEKSGQKKKTPQSSGAVVVTPKKKTVKARSAAGTAEAPAISIHAAPLDHHAIATAFSRTVSPQLNAAAESLKLLNLQAQATSEHRCRASEAQFKRNVAQRLRAYSARGRR